MSASRAREGAGDPAAVWVPTLALKPWAKNPRKNDHAVDGVAAAIGRFGFGAPILARREDGEIIAGHTRLKAAIKLGLERVPVRYLDLSEEEAHRLARTDNKLAELAEWDAAALVAQLNDENDADRLLQGFTAEDMRRLNAELLRATAVTDDEAPEPPAEPVARRGDIWILGRHRVVCGDSTDANDVAKALDGQTPALMVTDPPYGVEYDPKWRQSGGRTGMVQNDDNASWREAWALFPGGVAYVWHASQFTSVVQADLEDCGFETRAQIIWAKSQPVMSRGHYHWQHEPCWYAVRCGSTAAWVGDRKQTTVWEIQNINRAAGEDRTNHGTQKPVECMARPMKNHEGDIYDPFLGSGTSIVAAEQLGRRCFGLEIDPGYVDVVVQRWEKQTGQKAELSRAEAS
jgi:DNA modification methylase